MATLKQIEANRLNAQHSAGPRSGVPAAFAGRGKAVSSWNALKSGIDADSMLIWGEWPAHIYALIAEYTARHQPATPEERVLVDMLIRAEWHLRRLDKVDSHLWKHRFLELKEDRQTSGTAADLNERYIYGQVFAELDKTFARLQRRIDSFQRSYRTALQDLKRLQAERLAQSPEPPQPERCPVGPPPPQPIATEPTSAQIGFVPQIAPAAPSAPAETPVESAFGLGYAVGRPHSWVPRQAAEAARRRRSS